MAIAVPWSERVKLLMYLSDLCRGKSIKAYHAYNVLVYVYMQQSFKMNLRSIAHAALPVSTCKLIQPFQCNFMIFMIMMINQVFPGTHVIYIVQNHSVFWSVKKYLLFSHFSFQIY